MQENPKISVIVPIYNEEESIVEFYNRLKLALKDIAHEIIMVDDGSTDASLELIKELNNKDPMVRAISFSKNFGHMAALSAGLDFAKGDAVITIDADLQHPPELIPELIKKWQSGTEIVNTIRIETKGAGCLKNITANIFYWVMKKTAKINLPANAADYRLIDRKAVEALKTIKERSRFLRGLVGWIGFKQESIEYKADRRFAGKTKYSIGRMFAFAVDGITSFSTFPLKLSMYFGLAIAFLSFIYILYAIYIKLFTDQAIAGWTSVLVAVLFIGGIQLIFLGILGEYLSRVYDETKQRPLYIVSGKVGF
ncbi:glycosyltransferase family 2 protein [Candidatus Saganbacteria bacterium]|nr:glycosyltransferase family 2 protein [Candidatus Saganbacteria bacterium]